MVPPLRLIDLRSDCGLAYKRFRAPDHQISKSILDLRDPEQLALAVLRILPKQLLCGLALSSCGISHTS